ncbi:putative galacturonosyltransferase 14 [Hordeum vulgare]|nr:putative galacturonosyltransferase 14 [Hordeum vulgare]
MLADDYVAATANVFDEMGASDGLHDATTVFVHLLDDNTVESDQALIGDYGYNELDGVMHDRGDKEHGVEEVDKGVFDQEQAQARARSKNSTHLEDPILIKAWEAVSIDACTGTGQTTKRYWQRIDDQFVRMMANYPNRTPCTFRSLQGRWDVI